MKFHSIARICVVIPIAVCSGCGSKPAAGPHSLVDRDSLKVFAGPAFPKDLSCQIVVGGPNNPIFVMAGADQRIDRATIDLGLKKPAVSVVRRSTPEPSYLLNLLVDQPPGKGTIFLDLNMDGEWDVKETPSTEPPKHFIRVGTEWVQVDKVEGISSEKPTAARGKTRYSFEKGKWISAPAARTACRHWALGISFPNA
jgi:hypothetical protein